jgi:hypothetical protein
VNPWKLAFEVPENVSYSDSCGSYYDAAIDLARQLTEGSLLFYITSAEANFLDPIRSQELELLLHGIALGGQNNQAMSIDRH